MSHRYSLWRCEPNILDLLIAFVSAVAAAYAMARPNIGGAVAGVAIATALVPPLCSVGIALAYRQYAVGAGAALLFLTNLVAIVLAAAFTFRQMGITSAQSVWRTRRWVYRVVGSLAVVTIVLSFPLHRSLDRQIEQGKPQPISYPLPSSVFQAVARQLKSSQPGVELMAGGRPASLEDPADVRLYLVSQEPIAPAETDKLADIVRREMEDEELVIEFFLLRGNSSSTDKSSVIDVPDSVPEADDE